jgi:hypothetical protein
MKYENYLYDGYILEPLFHMIRKLNIVENAAVDFFYDEDRLEPGCMCGKCYDSPIYILDIYVRYREFVYSDERCNE